MWHRDTARSNEIARRREGCLANVCDEVVSEVSPICQVENLEDRLKIGALTNFEVLSHTRIQLEERLTSQIVEQANRALARTQTVPVLHAVGIRSTRIAECS